MTTWNGPAGIATSSPLGLFQIDDGFEARVGDWHEANAKFPGGVAQWADRVRSAGFQPGIWLAPFLAHPGARLIRSHPDWLLRTRRGLPVNAGFGWNSFARALDVTHPEVINFVRGLVRTATVEWGYEYLKLDFLYGGRAGRTAIRPDEDPRPGTVFGSARDSRRGWQ